MKHLLFVDDEPNVLDGLQRMLRPMRHEWEMTFVTSGEEALQTMEQAAFDVVVSDMRMPGMDGAQLLNQVQQRFPHIIRIVLSGQSDQEMIYQSIGATHQYLSKPCDPAALKTTIMRACALHELLGNELIRSLVTGLKKIPSQPTLYADMEKEARSEHSSLKTIAGIITNDMGMTAKILQLVNSPYFGMHGTVSSAEQAVNLLGLDTIRALVLTAYVFSQFPSSNSSLLNIDRLWKESLAVGALARAIMKAEDAPVLTVDQAYTAGLLHDVGTLMLAANMTDRYDAMLRRAYDDRVPVWEVERQEFGTTHAEVGAYLLGLWGLGTPIVEAVAFHHRPTNCMNDTLSPLTAVHVADELQHTFVPTSAKRAVRESDASYLEKLHVSNRLPHWQQLAEAMAKEKERSDD